MVPVVPKDTFLRKIVVFAKNLPELPINPGQNDT